MFSSIISLPMAVTLHLNSKTLAKWFWSQSFFYSSIFPPCTSPTSCLCLCDDFLTSSSPVFRKLLPSYAQINFWLTRSLDLNCVSFYTFISASWNNCRCP